MNKIKKEETNKSKIYHIHITFIYICLQTLFYILILMTIECIRKCNKVKKGSREKRKNLAVNEYEHIFGNKRGKILLSKCLVIFLLSEELQNLVFLPHQERHLF